ncbi:MAG: phage tail tape measure protein [Thermovenabulum sp.]|uniref:phage tail tape measure protein n=1 Tax=Thermovenabulum sp. TaxID=3100335 RepID=UPI003C7A37ED
MAKVIDAIIQLRDNFSAQMEKVTDSMVRAQKQINRLSKEYAKVGKDLQKAGDSLTKSITLPVVGAGVAAVKFAMDFENGMAKVATIADTTKVSLDTIRKGLITLSNQTGISVNELTEAEYQALSAGVDTANSVKFLEAAVKAAKGGFTDTTTAVDALSTVLNAYGLTAKEAKRITDEMMVAQNYGKTTFGEMAKSIGNVIPIASALNVSTKELFASIAVLTKNGIQTSEAVTGLKAALSNIMKPSSEASKLAKQLGLDFSAAHLQSVGWAKFLEEVRQKTHNNAAQMAVLFGSVEALNAVTVLAGKGAKDFSTALDMMKNSAGTTDKAFEQVTKTTGARLNKSLNSLKNSAIQFGDAISPMVEKVADAISKIADRFNSLTPEQQKTIMYFAIMAASLGPVLKTTGKIFTTVSNVTKRVSDAIKVFKTSASIGRALLTIIGPANLVVLAVIAIAVAAFLIIKYWKPIKKFFAELWEGIKQKAVTAWNFITDSVKGFINSIIKGLNLLIDGINKLHFKVPNWVPLIGGKEWGFNLPKIPMLAAGTDYFQGGPAIVGEKGPELVYLPRGSKVIDNQKTEKLLSSKKSVNVTINVEKMEVRSEADLKKFAEMFVSMLEKEVLNYGGAG